MYRRAPRGFIATLVFLAVAWLCGASSMAVEGVATATFAGGCFWCMEPAFDKLAEASRAASKRRSVSASRL